MIDEIRLQDTIVLDDDNEYLVVGKTLYDEVNYLYLVNVSDYSIKFVAVTGDNVITLDNNEDKELIKRLTPLFLNNISKNYAKLLNDNNN